jgi:hypothetical protein
MNMMPGTLEKLGDVELRAAIERATEILKQRDDERKAKALSDAKGILAAAGLSLKDLNGKKAKGVVYAGGHTYQHPTNKELIWKAIGKKPKWLRALETEGGKPVEVKEGANA